MEQPLETDSYPAPRLRIGYRFIQWVARSFFRTLFGLRVEGREKIPAQGPFILVCNHQSWFDPPIVASTFPREIFFAAKRELFDKPVLGQFVRYCNSIPVKRTGYDRALLERLGEALEAGFGVIVFPEGTRHLDGRLHPPKPGVGMIALNHRNIPIIPVFIRGSARIRRQLLHRNLRLKFGNPFTLPASDSLSANDRDGYRKAAELVMERIAETGGVPVPPGIPDSA